MNLEHLRGQLLVLEGQDHSGKTTIGKMMTDFLNKEGVETIFTFQPGDAQFGKHAEITREFCTRKTYNLDPLSNFFAFLLDRSENTSKVVIPALKEGKTVIADRWWYSTIAYQFYGKQLLKKYEMDIKFAKWMNILASHYASPDVVLYFQRDEKAVQEHKNDENDIFEIEKNDFKARVKEAYETLIQDPIFEIVEVNNDPYLTLKRALEVSCEHIQAL